MEQRELTAPRLTRFDRAAFGVVAGLLAVVFAYLLAYGLLRTSVFDPAEPAGEHVLYVWDNVAVNLAMLLGWLVLLRMALRFERRIRLGWLTGMALPELRGSLLLHLINDALVVALVVWLWMPIVTRLFAGWLKKN